jgi:hypothetical protein
LRLESLRASGDAAREKATQAADVKELEVMNALYAFARAQR